MTANADATEPLWNWDFRKWFAGRTISTLGTEATAIAIPVLIFQQTGSPALTGLVSAVIVLPYLVFGLIAGGVADRMNRSGLMVASDLVGAMALISIPIAHLAGLHSTVHILVVTFVVWTAFVWFDAASFGALIAVVGKSKLAAANSALWSSATVVGIVVPALAGIVIALWGPEVILMADALSAVASALLIMRIRTDLRPTAVVDGSSEKLWRSIREGLRFIWASTTLRLATLGMAALTFAGGLAMGLLVVFFARALDAPQGALGVFFAVAGGRRTAGQSDADAIEKTFRPGTVDGSGVSRFCSASGPFRFRPGLGRFAGDLDGLEFPSHAGDDQQHHDPPRGDAARTARPGQHDRPDDRTLRHPGRRFGRRSAGGVRPHPSGLCDGGCTRSRGLAGFPTISALDTVDGRRYRSIAPFAYSPPRRPKA